MTVFIVIIVLIAALVGFGLMGWFLKFLEVVVSFLFDGIGEGLGVIFRGCFWLFIIFFVIFGLAML